MRLAVALALGGVLMWTAQLPAGAAPAQQEVIEDSQPAPVAPQAPAFNRAALVDGVVQLSNAERAKVGAPPLTVNAELMKAAQDYAAVLAPASSTPVSPCQLCEIASRTPVTRTRSGSARTSQLAIRRLRTW